MQIYKKRLLSVFVIGLFVGFGLIENGMDNNLNKMSVSSNIESGNSNVSFKGVFNNSNSIKQRVTDTVYLNPIDDTYAFELNVNGNYGFEIDMGIGTFNIYNAISYLKFDLNDLPDNTVDIVDASLILYCEHSQGSGNFVTFCRRITGGNWDESTLTWANKPVWSQEYICPTQISSENSYIVFNGLEDCVDKWFDGYWDNFGFVVWANEMDVDWTAVFMSKEGSISPQLWVEYEYFVSPVLPTVQSDDATNEDETSVKLHGQIIDDGGEDCEIRFRLKEKGTGSWFYPSEWHGIYNSGETFEEIVTGLTPNTEYEFQAGGKNSAGEEWGNTEYFQTLAFVGPDWLECLLDKAGLEPNWEEDHWDISLSISTSNYNSNYYLSTFDFSVPAMCNMNEPLCGIYNSIGKFKITIDGEIYPDNPVLNNIILGIPSTSHSFSLPFGSLSGGLSFSGTHALRDGVWGNNDIYFDASLSTNLLETHFNTVIVVIPVTVELDIGVGAGVTTYLNSPCDWTGVGIPENVFNPQGYVALTIYTSAGIGFDFGCNIRASLGVYGEGSAKWYCDHFNFGVDLGLYGEIWIYEGRWSLYSDSWDHYWKNGQESFNFSNINSSLSHIDIKDEDWTIIPRDYGEPYWLNNDRGMLIDEVLPFSHPDIDSNNSNKMIVWGYDNQSKLSVDGLELKYSIWNGTDWSQPECFTDDDYPQMYPSLEYLENGDVLCVYSMISEENITEFGSFSEKIETGYSYWNHNTQSWTNPTILEYTDEYFDLKPELASYQNEAVVIWASDQDGDFFTINDTVVYTSFWNGSEWQNTRKILSGNIIPEDISIAFNEGEAAISYTIDADGNLSTFSDQNIFVKRFTSDENISRIQITNDSYKNTLSSIEYLSEDPGISWIREIGNETFLLYSEITGNTCGSHYIVTEGSIMYPKLFYEESKGRQPYIGWTDYENLSLGYSTFIHNEWKNILLFDFDNYVGDVSWQYADSQMTATFIEKTNITSNTNCTLNYLFNRKPIVPGIPIGPTNGEVDVSYSFSVDTEDDDNDQLFYQFSWGDGTNSSWIGPYNSGESVTRSHSWCNVGNYDVKIRVKDEYDIQTDWSDQLLIEILGSNDAPSIPDNPTPSNGAQDVSLSPFLGCSVNDPNNDQMVVSFYWGTGEQIMNHTSVVTDTNGFMQVQIDDLESTSDYWWYVETDDGIYISKSETWSFTTIGYPPDKPNTPTGFTNVFVNNTSYYITTTVDSDGDQIFYKFDWDDDFPTGWIGPFDSGAICNISHVWLEEGVYDVKVKAKDGKNEESTWSDILRVIVNKKPVFSEINLNAYWNLLTIPLNISCNASDIADNITGCLSISGWDNLDQEYQTYIVSGPSAFDFKIIPGFGYFVDMNQNDSLMVCGQTIDSVSISLGIGWNLLGWYHEYDTTAISIAENITGCISISKWNASAQTYNTYIVGGPVAFDFTVSRGMGLFVDVNQTSTWYGEG